MNVGTTGTTAKLTAPRPRHKGDVHPPGEEPAFEYIERLLKLGAKVGYHDPCIPVAPRMFSRLHLVPMKSVPLTGATLRAQDAVVTATDRTGQSSRMRVTSPKDTIHLLQRLSLPTAR